MDPNNQQSNSEPQINQAPKPEKQNKSGSFMMLSGFVILIVLLLAGILNYFNILPLSSYYPNQLDFLPHIENKIQVPPVNTKTAGFEASEADKAKFASYAISNLDKNPVSASNSGTDSALKELVTEGILTGYKNDTLTLTTANGIVSFILDTNPLYYAENNLSNANDLSFDTTSKEAVENPSNIGKLMQINYDISKSSVNQAKNVYLLKKNAN